MGLTEDNEDNIEQRYEELCLELNMDANAKEEAWQAYERINTNYTLEGDTLHWLACALYVACRNSVLPTVGKGVMEGNCVSLTRLLRSSKLSLIQFFTKMKKWADMSNLPQEFRDKVDRLERNFAVSTVIFKKFEPIFLDIFKNPADDPPKVPRSRKQRRLPCTPGDVFSFCWTMFVQVKGNFPAISDDLVNSYHLLLCCVDWFYGNALVANRKDLINGDFSGLPDNFHNPNFKSQGDTPCIIDLLCTKHEGLVLEAKGIKEHWWKPYIKKLYEKKVLKGKADTLTGILDVNNFEANSKAINSGYEEWVLSVGDFDERIFLGEGAQEEIGTPAKSSLCMTGELSERMQVKKNLKDHISQTKSLAPSTPLTGRRYLKEKDPTVTPVSTATQGVSRLQGMLSGRKTCPSEELLDIFSCCDPNPHEDITERVKEMGEIFCANYIKPSEDQPGSHIDFAKKRLQLGESLYYKALENIMLREKERLGVKNVAFDFAGLLEQDVFHRSLFAICLEIVIFSYNSQRIFPWIVECFNLSPYYFYKVIEVLIRAEDGLSRDVVKHLNHIEETILESLAWKTDSPLWDAIKAQLVPSCEDVALPSQIEGGSERASSSGPPQLVGSPIMHPQLRRIVGENRSVVQLRKVDPMQSPTGPSAADRFSSPSPGTAKRRLFGSSAVQGSATTVSQSPGSVGPPSQVITLQQAQTPDGRQILIPVSIVAGSGEGSPSIKGSTPNKNRPKKGGSLALFFRKVYHLASVRLRDLCEKLGINEDLRRKMWTCFEYSLINHSTLMQDRHLDQLLMCAIYVMAKVTGSDQSFQEIMKCYRHQPQAQSHVYRSVLLKGVRERHTSGGSNSSNGASGDSSPVNVEEDKPVKEKEKKRTERLTSIRSTSTLPVPHPSSQPPTPTRLSGTGTVFEFEERGDLIKFYNTIYVTKLKAFALKFSAQNQRDGNLAPALSPLPLPRRHPTSPRRVSEKHSVYISPAKQNGSMPLTPTSRMLYCFNRSPAKDLRAINNMIRMGERQKMAGKRILQEETDSAGSSPAKRINLGPGNNLQQRLQALTQDRTEANGTR